LNSGTQSVLILEDDAFPLPGFTDNFQAFWKALPSDWGMIYLGGEPWNTSQRPATRINDLVYRPWNVNRTHAYALRGNMMRAVYQHLCDTNDWQLGHHIDHHLGRLHEMRRHPIYCPKQWLMGQREGESDISGKVLGQREFSSMASAGIGPFVAIVGLHRSGSSCVAGVVNRLGVHLGNHFVGCEPNGGYEAEGLARICEVYAPFPETQPQLDSVTVANRLMRWLRNRDREARLCGKIAGGKYPHLCLLGQQLIDICQDALYVVHCDRPLEESIASLIRREDGKHRSETLKALQRQLWEHKQCFLQTPGLRVHTVDYHALQNDPAGEVQKLAEFLPIETTEEQRQAAAAYVQPDLCHVRL
jgi:hypothetical protein